MIPVNELHDGSGRAELARSLRRLRKAAGFSQEALGERAGLSQTQVSRAESDRRLLKPAQVRAFAEACSTPDSPVPAEEIDRLVTLAEQVASEFVDARVVLQRGAVTFQDEIARLEEDSALIRAYQPSMVLGQVQTRAYVRTLMAIRPGRSQGEIDALVEQRMRRNQMLYDPARRWELAMTEGALLWGVGGPEVMAEQMAHLIELTYVPSVDLMIVPGRTPVDFVTLHGFHIYDADAVIVGTMQGTSRRTKPEDIREFAELHTRIRAVSVHGEEARRLLSRVRDDYLRDAR